MYSKLGNAVVKTAGKTWQSFSTLERLLLSAGSLIAIGVTLGLGQAIGVPLEPGFNGSLLAGHSPILAIIITIIVVAISMVVGSLVAVFLEEEGGLFCAAIGLAALGIRCGPVRPVFQFASGPSVLLAMAFESLLLGAIVAGAWWGLAQLFSKVRSKQLLPAAAAAPNEIVDATLSQKFTALGVQILAMGFLEQILIQSDVKAQALAGVGVAGFVGVLIAYQVCALPTGIWYWSGPSLVGAIGYLMAFLSPDGLNVGEIHGWAAALARPVPLDYAGLGTAGALFGYWTARRWAQPEDNAEDSPAMA